MIDATTIAIAFTVYAIFANIFYRRACRTRWSDNPIARSCSGMLYVLSAIVCGIMWSSV